MKKKSKINRRQFLTIMSGCCAGALIPIPVFCNHLIFDNDNAQQEVIHDVSGKMDPSAKIKVIGVGGAGGNAINHMIDENIQGVKFISIDTSDQALEISKAQEKILIGERRNGRGAIDKPQIGREAAIENAGAIRNALCENHMVFIIAGLGGWTGTGAAPVIAEICKEMKTLTVAAVTMPFFWEGQKRVRQAEEGIRALNKVADTIITIPNDRIAWFMSEDAKIIDILRRSDEYMLHSVKGITDLIFMPGLITLNFQDIKKILSEDGVAVMGIGKEKGKNGILKATENAISHPFMKDIPISKTKGVIMNISASQNSHDKFNLEELFKGKSRITDEISKDADILWRTVVDDSLNDDVLVTIIMTGI